MDTTEKIIAILVNFRPDTTLINRFNGNTDIINEIGLDSLELINFILQLEDEFKIEIDYESFNYSFLSSINKLSAFIETQRVSI